MSTTKNKIVIKTVLGSVLWESEKETVREAVVEKYQKDANLRGAYLQGADLQGAYLQGAYLQGAYLQDADLQDAYLRGAYLRGADLRGANLQGADLRGAKNIPQSYIDQCSRDILFVLQHLKAEVPFLREKIIRGEVDGTQYEGDCACLIGTLAKADGGLEKVCAAIPFYTKGLENYGEQWFWQIRKGDTPENSFFAAHALKLCDMVINSTYAL